VVTGQQHKATDVRDLVKGIECRACALQPEFPIAALQAQTAAQSKKEVNMGPIPTIFFT
jgi:hypothetical protein